MLFIWTKSFVLRKKKDLQRYARHLTTLWQEHCMRREICRERCGSRACSQRRYYDAGIFAGRKIYENCRVLKQELLSLCKGSNREVLVRIACHELEHGIGAICKQWEKQFIDVVQRKDG